MKFLTKLANTNDHRQPNLVINCGITAAPIIAPMKSIPATEENKIRRKISEISI